MTDPSGTHASRKRLARMAEMSPGPPERPSDPGTWRVRLGWLMPMLGVLLGSAATAGTLYATYTSRLDAVETQSQQVATTLAAVEAASRARDESLSDRVTAVEREVAVHASEARATTRALEQLTEEIRELRAAVQRRR